MCHRFKVGLGSSPEIRYTLFALRVLPRARHPDRRSRVCLGSRAGSDRLQLTGCERVLPLLQVYRFIPRSAIGKPQQNGELTVRPHRRAYLVRDGEHDADERQALEERGCEAEDCCYVCV